MVLLSFVVQLFKKTFKDSVLLHSLQLLRIVTYIQPYLPATLAHHQRLITTLCSLVSRPHDTSWTASSGMAAALCQFQWSRN